MSEPLVGIVVGSESDRERMQDALDELAARGISHEFEVRSEHRQPDAVAEYGRTARERGLRVLIAGAGLAAALPGVLAARTAMARIWSDESRLARWLDVELAALEGWSEVGAIPAADVAEIQARAVPPTPQRVAEIERVTDHDVAAFVDAVAEQLGPPGRWLHYGLTSSDVVDTALALQIQEAGGLLLEGIEQAFAVVAARAEEHRHTICIGRSHGVHAEPTTFGWKLAGWAFELDRARARVAR